MITDGIDLKPMEEVSSEEQSGNLKIYKNLPPSVIENSQDKENIS